MNAYLLDTTAIIAHFRKEPGYAQVQDLFNDPGAAVLIAAPSLLELDIALSAKVQDETRRRAVVIAYGGQLAEVVSADGDAARAAIAVRGAAAKRVPAMDALIAGCAAARGAVLVHSDPHFDAVPAEQLKTLRLREGGYPTSGDVPPVVKEECASYKSGKSKTRRKP